MHLRVPIVSIAVLVSIAGCAGPGRSTSIPSGGADGRATAAPQRITIGILGNPYTLSQAINTGGTGSVRGVGETEKIIHAGLAVRDGTGNLQPELAEAVPSLDNGNWRVLPDGRMETTWKIKPNAQWHDGVPVTAADLAFTLRVGQDKDLALPGYPGFRTLDAMDVVDDHTVTVRWKRPFIEADTLFTSEFAIPWPSHLLEQAYLADKSTFLSLPFWTTDYVGAGPFKLREFVRDSHMVVEAFDGYVLGRPKLDQIQIKFIQDPNALIANVLAGEVDVTIGRGFNLEQLLQVAGQWPTGRMESSPSSWVAHYVQALTPNPQGLGDVRFRRGLLHALDRQGMSDALQAGQAPVAHSLLEVGDPLYKAVEPQIVKYDYEPRRATALFEEMGLTRGADGFFRDAAGQRLSVESRTNAEDDVKAKIVFSGADYWRQVGIETETVIVPRQLASDREYRATFPGFDLVRQPFEPERLISSEAALPENRFNGKNRTRYQNPELDGYVDTYLTTIPQAERTGALGRVVHLISDQLPALGVFYAPEPKLIGNRVLNVKAAEAPGSDETWNAHLWQVR